MQISDNIKRVFSSRDYNKNIAAALENLVSMGNRASEGSMCVILSQHFLLSVV